MKALVKAKAEIVTHRFAALNSGNAGKVILDWESL